VVSAVVCAPGLGALAGPPEDGLGDDQRKAQVQGELEGLARRAADREVGRALAEAVEFRQPRGQSGVVPEDARVGPQQFPEVVEQRLGVVCPVAVGQRRQVAEVSTGAVLEQFPVGVDARVETVGDGPACDFAEGDGLGQGVAPEPVGAVDAGHRLADGVEPVDPRLADVVDHDSAHAVVCRGGGLDGFFGDVDAQLREPLVHPGQPLLDERPLAVGDVEVHRVVCGSTSRRYLLGDGPRDHITRVELNLVGGVPLHEPLAVGVIEATALATDRLGDQTAVPLVAVAAAGHPGRVELDERYVHQLGAGLVGEHRPVAGVGVETGGTVDRPVVGYQLRDEDVLAVGDRECPGPLDERGQQRLAGVVAGEGGPPERLGAEVPLVDLAVGRPAVVHPPVVLGVVGAQRAVDTPTRSRRVDIAVAPLANDQDPTIDGLVVGRRLAGSCSG
jgi:hypothetical protein